MVARLGRHGRPYDAPLVAHAAHELVGGTVRVDALATASRSTRSASSSSARVRSRRRRSAPSDSTSRRRRVATLRVATAGRDSPAAVLLDRRPQLVDPLVGGRRRGEHRRLPRRAGPRCSIWRQLAHDRRLRRRDRPCSRRRRRRPRGCRPSPSAPRRRGRAPARPPPCRSRPPRRPRPGPTPTVSTMTRSYPAASRIRTASGAASAIPPRCPRVAIDRMNTSGSVACSCIRTRSPSRAPPV